jgi:hypothetical protein
MEEHLGIIYSIIITEKERELLQNWFPVKNYWMIEDF